MAVDTPGHLLALHITPADVGDRTAVRRLAADIQDATGDCLVADHCGDPIRQAISDCAYRFEWRQDAALGWR